MSSNIKHKKTTTAQEVISGVCTCCFGPSKKYSIEIGLRVITAEVLGPDTE
jgi:hypothetical protein